MPHRSWEDYQAGMYATRRCDPDTVRAAARLLSDSDQFAETATEMLREWPNAAVHNLRHMWSGRNAWLGQASCCYAVGAIGAETREAWGTLTNSQQREANRIATDVRTAWEKGDQDAQTTLGL